MMKISGINLIKHGNNNLLVFAARQDTAILKSNWSDLVNFMLKQVMSFVARFIRFRENQCDKLRGCGGGASAYPANLSCIISS